jgi:hypothetical protein
LSSIPTKSEPWCVSSSAIIDDGRYPHSERIRTLKGILDKLVPPPVREPLPPPKVYAPPRATPKQRRGRR